jgi:hypothetical protein
MNSLRTRPAVARAAAIAALFCDSVAASAIDVNFQPVAPGVYALIGQKGGRTYENEGLGKGTNLP